MACKGVQQLKGMQVVSTGWVYIDGAHAVRDRGLKQRLKAKGAQLRPEFSGLTDLLILGELRGYQLQDDRVGGVDALEQLWRSRQEGWRHVHLVNASDLPDLFAGHRVPCRRTPARWEDMKKRLRESVRRGHS